MLVNLVPEFLACIAAPDPVAAYHGYLDRHRPVLQSYWDNYVLDLDSPHADRVIADALRAERGDLERLLEDMDVERVAQDALARALELLEADCPVDLYLMVGVGAANAGELVIGGRGVAFVCLEHFTGKANPHTSGLGLAPHLLPLWIAHEVAHAVRYTSPTIRAALRRFVAEVGGYYDYWDTGSRASLRELLVNEGGAVVGVFRLQPPPVPAHPRARRLPAPRRGARPRGLWVGPPAAVAVERALPGRATRGGAGAPRAQRLLSGVAARGELPRRARGRVDGAGRLPRVPAGGRSRDGDPDGVSPKRKSDVVERRRNRPLREVLDEFLEHARELTRRSRDMTPVELDYAQQRLEWLADEVWRLVTGQEPPQ